MSGLRLPLIGWLGYLRIFLRTIGLHVLNSVDRWFLQKAAGEQPKAVIYKSRFIALFRCCIHIVPATLSIFLLSITFCGYFIGWDLAGTPGNSRTYLSVLQVAAKTHSRRSPFGLLGSALSFSQLSFFWTQDFIGAVSSKANCKANRGLIFYLFITGLLATSTGPASAILMIARKVEMPAGGTSYYVKGSASQLWPDTIGIEHYDPFPELNSGAGKFQCMSHHAHLSSFCPNGGPPEYPGKSTAHHGEPLMLPSGVGVLIRSLEGMVSSFTMDGRIRGSHGERETITVGTHAPTILLQQRLNKDWTDALYNKHLPGPSYSRLKYYETQRAVVLTRVPVVRCVCVLQDPNATTRRIFMPVLPEFKRATSEDKWVNEVVLVTISSLATHTFSKAARVSWVDQNITGFPPEHRMTTGLLFEAPWGSNQSRSAFGCSIDARWANADTIIEYPGFSESRITATMRDKPDNGFINSFLPHPEPSAGWSRINVTPEWLETVNFKLPSNSSGKYEPR
ncbi:hypothetical protein P152DRAFT_487951 [Eremomyces bilateralis CBS 781.70]|uniref:Uncharacterized protein n=1 Tax=Eremomyces bilateralis CBS 781.70 TaxID=1392243 RepID=A0A6G1G2W4_9PEZI|nr:uncharacterized protein P152DRAFT_487951 [Eremomyces bilateralis CBS 781.70]KAF1812332.1 hypothetical protein P152DRAFT_487951 [Eremomyces bilateralis CBS 781.70]